MTLDDCIIGAQGWAGELGTVVDRDDQAGTATLELNNHTDWQAIEINAGLGHTNPVPRNRLMNTLRDIKQNLPDSATCTTKLDSWALAQGITSSQANRAAIYAFLKALGAW